MPTTLTAEDLHQLDEEPEEDSQFLRALRRLQDAGCDVDPEAPVAAFGSAW